MLQVITAKVIADSISPIGSRLTTIEATFHRFILAEVNTHRAFSRNSASSRAIPTAKLIEQVESNPAVPLEFGSNKPGMQAGAEISDPGGAELAWLVAAQYAVDIARDLADYGVHKQIVNRVLEPFMWHTAIISSTQAGWDNFFEQRLSSSAQPEINQLAFEIWMAMENSEPRTLEYGCWHTPYVDEAIEEQDLKLSAARCARVSYMNHGAGNPVEKDLALYERLITNGHWSPLEHVATPAPIHRTPGNFHGWGQLRHMPGYR